MKKILAAILVFVITAGTLFIPAQCLSAEDFTGDRITVIAKQGDTVEIVSVVKDVKLLNGLLVKMHYDSSLLSYEDAQKTKLGRSLINTDEENRVSWSIMFAAKGTDILDAAEVNVLKFTAKSDISSEITCFSYSIEEFYDTSSTELPHSKIDVFCRVNGNRIMDIPPALYGDANNDGKVTNADSMAILRHVIKVTILPDDRLIRCDINNDGKITNADALQITRFCVGLPSKYPIGETVTFR